MQLGKHYSITIRGQEYHTVCVGSDDSSCYLKDINGNLLVIPYSDDLAFSTVGETFKYNDELNKICDKEADKEFDLILEEAFAAKKLISPDKPLQAYNRQFNVEETVTHLQNLNNSLRKIEELLQVQSPQMPNNAFSR